MRSVLHIVNTPKHNLIYDFFLDLSSVGPTFNIDEHNYLSLKVQ